MNSILVISSKYKLLCTPNRVIRKLWTYELRHTLYQVNTSAKECFIHGKISALMRVESHVIVCKLFFFQYNPWTEIVHVCRYSSRNGALSFGMPVWIKLLPITQRVVVNAIIESDLRYDQWGYI